MSAEKVAHWYLPGINLRFIQTQRGFHTKVWLYFISFFRNVFSTLKTSMMEHSAKILNGKNPQTIFAKLSLTEIWVNSKYTSVSILHRYCYRTLEATEIKVAMKIPHFNLKVVTQLLSACTDIYFLQIYKRNTIKAHKKTFNVKVHISSCRRIFTWPKYYVSSLLCLVFENLSS